MIGPGKYDGLCTEARQKAQARGAMLIIADGEVGWGFSCQLPLDLLLKMPGMLRGVADQIEADLKKGKL